MKNCRSIQNKNLFLGNRMVWEGGDENPTQTVDTIKIGLQKPVALLKEPEYVEAKRMYDAVKKNKDNPDLSGNVLEAYKKYMEAFENYDVEGFGIKKDPKRTIVKVGENGEGNRIAVYHQPNTAIGDSVRRKSSSSYEATRLSALQDKAAQMQYAVTAFLRTAVQKRLKKKSGKTDVEFHDISAVQEAYYADPGKIENIQSLEARAAAAPERVKQAEVDKKAEEQADKEEKAKGDRKYEAQINNWKDGNVALLNNRKFSGEFTDHMKTVAVPRVQAAIANLDNLTDKRIPLPQDTLDHWKGLKNRLTAYQTAEKKPTDRKALFEAYAALVEVYEQYSKDMEDPDDGFITLELKKQFAIYDSNGEIKETAYKQQHNLKKDDPANAKDKGLVAIRTEIETQKATIEAIIRKTYGVEKNTPIDFKKFSPRPSREAIKIFHMCVFIYFYECVFGVFFSLFKYECSHLFALSYWFG